MEDCRHGQRDSRPFVEFTRDGNDERDPASGRGWAVIEEDGSLSLCTRPATRRSCRKSPPTACAVRGRTCCARLVWISSCAALVACWRTEPAQAIYTTVDREERDAAAVAVVRLLEAKVPEPQEPTPEPRPEVQGENPPVNCEQLTGREEHQILERNTGFEPATSTLARFRTSLVLFVIS